MTEPRLRTGLWVQAILRRLDLSGFPAVLVHRGDDIAGTVMVKIVEHRNGVRVLTRRTGPDGWVWHAASGEAPEAEPEADARIARERARDPDLWVIEVEDPRARFDVARDLG